MFFYFFIFFTMFNCFAERNNFTDDINEKKDDYCLELRGMLNLCPKEMTDELYNIVPYLQNLSFKTLLEELNCLKHERSKGKISKDLKKLRNKHSHNQLFFMLISYELFKLAYLQNDSNALAEYNEDLKSAYYFISVNVLRMNIIRQMQYMDKMISSPREYECAIDLIKRFLSPKILEIYLKKYALCSKQNELKNMCESSNEPVEKIWNTANYANISKYTSNEAMLLFAEFLISQEDKELSKDADIVLKHVNVDLLEPECVNLYKNLINRSKF